MLDESCPPSHSRLKFSLIFLGWSCNLNEKRAIMNKNKAFIRLSDKICWTLLKYCGRQTFHPMGEGSQGIQSTLHLESDVLPENTGRGTDLLRMCGPLGGCGPRRGPKGSMTWAVMVQLCLTPPPTTGPGNSDRTWGSPPPPDCSSLCLQQQDDHQLATPPARQLAGCLTIQGLMCPLEEVPGEERVP